MCWVSAGAFICMRFKYKLYVSSFRTQGESRSVGNRKSRAPPGHPRSEEARILEGTVFWSDVSSKSSSPPLRGRPDDGSHAPDILARGHEPWNWP
ncbi:zinc finger protein 23 isoform X4 [Cervus elaphus]|uniref:zinc finger protein 23 isoform X4 n=1 Tax=Cervus elaphus TaxID=9860 RepID=UPI001CC2FDE8|nr:zinc finger protein 23 isoform X4 [Cervus elaphus]